jgi:hypothetical protein
MPPPWGGGGVTSSPKQTAAASRMPRLRSIYKSTSVHSVNNGGVNALAVADRSRNFIGVYGGAPYVPAGLCCTVMRCANVWPSAENALTGGSPESYLAAAQVAQVYRSAATGVGDLGHIKGRYFQWPEDPIRRQLAEGLFLTAIEFLFSHELSHVTRGHLDVFADRGAAAIFEAESPHGPVAHARLRQ